ncbi:MAG: VOC family protein [Anaerolineaceae bacterium]|nr:VOC family protein [Anaerolineaceae bacterium]
MVKDKIKDFQHVTTTVRDKQEAMWFYQELLGFKRAGRLSYGDARDFVIDFMDIGNNYLLELFYFKKELYQPTERLENDKQEGMRHIGFKTNDLYKLAKKLKNEGIEFLTEPGDALGGVQAAVVKDPSGTVIKLVEGNYQYDMLGDETGLTNFPQSEELVFDHLTITVSNLDESFNFYSNIFKFPYLGKIVINDSKEGKVISHFRIGNAILELYSFDIPTIPFLRNHDNTHLGLRHFGLLVDEVDPVMVHLKSIGAPILYQPVDAIGGVRTCFFSDPDTVAIELIDGTCTYNG